jgi:hypothetical protein
VEIPIDRHGEGFKLITRIQDEAHRFAIEYHRSLRSKSQVKSVLDDIPGIGPTRRKALMKTFQSLENIRNATASNICFYMAINQINKDYVDHVCRLARDTDHVKAVSFNFHTPYPDTKELALSKEEKAKCCDTIKRMMDEGCPGFNLKSAFPYLIENKFPTPCHQCLVIEDGKISTCGRCIEVPGLCEQCGYFFVAEYTLLFRGNVKIIFEMLRTYLKYI